MFKSCTGIRPRLVLLGKHSTHDSSYTVENLNVQWHQLSQECKLHTWKRPLIKFHCFALFKCLKCLDVQIILKWTKCNNENINDDLLVNESQVDELGICSKLMSLFEFVQIVNILNTSRQWVPCVHTTYR